MEAWLGLVLEETFNWRQKIKLYFQTKVQPCLGVNDAPTENKNLWATGNNC